MAPRADELTERPAELLRPEERRSLRLHQVIARRVGEDPGRAAELARANLDRMRLADERGLGEPWRKVWSDLLEGPVEVMVALLVSTSTYGSQLRQTAPFAGLLSPRERWAAYRE